MNLSTHVQISWKDLYSYHYALKRVHDPENVKDADFHVVVNLLDVVLQERP